MSNNNGIELARNVRRIGHLDHFERLHADDAPGELGHAFAGITAPQATDGKENPLHGVTFVPSPGGGCAARIICVAVRPSAAARCSAARSACRSMVKFSPK